MKKRRGLSAEMKRFICDLTLPLQSKLLPLSEVWPRVVFSSERNKPCSFSFNSSGDYVVSLSPETTEVLSNYAATSLTPVAEGVSLYSVALSSLMHEYAHVLWFRALPPRTLRLFEAVPEAAAISEIPALWLQADTIAKINSIPRTKAFEVLAKLSGIPIGAIEVPKDDDDDDERLDPDSYSYVSAFSIAMTYGPAVTIDDVVAEAVENSLDMVCPDAGSA